MNIIKRYCVPLLFGFAMIVPWCVCSTCKVSPSRGMLEVRSWALTGCLDIFTLSANVRISKWLLLGYLVGIFAGFLSPRFALGHTSRSLLGWLGLCSRGAIGHSLSHTKHHHHNYHDHNRNDGNDDNRHYHYHHHHPEALVQTMLIGPLGWESRFLEWVNWKYFSNIGERADNIIHNHNWSLSYYVPSTAPWSRVITINKRRESLIN